MAETKTTTKDVEIVRTGTQIVMPPGMSYDEGILWLTRKKEEQEAKVAIHEEFQGYVLDVALAFTQALREIYGWVSLEPTPGFFGDTPPYMVGVKIDAKGTTVQVPWGRIKVPNVDGFLQTGIGLHEGKPIFVLGGATKKKCLPQIEAITAKTREIAAKHSIYKGKAIRYKHQEQDEENPNPFNGVPEFIDVSDVKCEELIFPQDVQNLVNVNLFAPVQRTAACRAVGVPMKRGVLLEGPYGCGKSLTARVMARKCEDNGWTFVLVPDVAYLSEALQFVKDGRFAPAVVFAEDIDRADDGTRTDALNEILNTLDGVELKDLEIMTVLTTNHVDKIHKSMLRPGRLDAVIPVRPPDQVARMALIHQYARNLLAPGQDLNEASQVLDGTIPAVIREVVERAKLAAVWRGESPLRLTAGDLLISAQGMMAHLDLLKEQTAVKDDVKAALRTVGQALTAH